MENWHKNFELINSPAIYGLRRWKRTGEHFQKFLREQSEERAFFKQ